MTPEVGGDGRSDVFERLGIPTIINAKGTATRVSGALLAPEVAEAMRTDAGYVTSGEAAGLLLGTAAAVTRPWLFVFPAFVLIILLFAISLVGDALRDAIDPTSGMNRD